jgi:DNA polymerase-3 subunit delta'
MRNTFLCGNQNGKITENQSCNLKFQKISHPDLHFVYPTVTTEEVKRKPKVLISLLIETIHN